VRAFEQESDSAKTTSIKKCLELPYWSCVACSDVMLAKLLVPGHSQHVFAFLLATKMMVLRVFLATQAWRPNAAINAAVIDGLIWVIDGGGDFLHVLMMCPTCCVTLCD